MSKKNKSARVEEAVEEVAPEVGTGETLDAGSDEVAKPAIGELVAAYRRADGAYKEAEALVNRCDLARSRALQSIVQNYGTGPFQLGGKTVTIIGRAKKGALDEDGEQLIFYYFRTLGQHEVVTLD